MEQLQFHESSLSLNDMIKKVRPYHVVPGIFPDDNVYSVIVVFIYLIFVVGIVLGTQNIKLRDWFLQT